MHIRIRTGVSDRLPNRHLADARLEVTQASARPQAGPARPSARHHLREGGWKIRQRADLIYQAEPYALLTPFSRAVNIHSVQTLGSTQVHRARFS